MKHMYVQSKVDDYNNTLRGGKSAYNDKRRFSVTASVKRLYGVCCLEDPVCCQLAGVIGLVSHFGST